jgi:O-antigen/teichoic acid export membrane protein
MDLIRKVTTNAGIILVGTLLQRAVQFLLVIYVARSVSVDVFGQYNLALAILFIASFFVDMGIGPASVREIARNRSGAQHLFSHILALRIVLSAALYFAVVGYTMLSGYSDSTRTLILLLSLSLFTGAVSGACETLNVAFENMRMSVVVRFIGMVIGGIGSVSAMYLGYGLTGFVIANFVAEAGTALFWAMIVRKKYFRYSLGFDVQEWRKILAQATPFALMLFFQQMNRNLNVIFLSKIPGPIPPQMAIGYYSSAAQVARVATPLLISVRQAIIPSLAAGSYDEETHASLLKWTTKGILLTVCFPLALAGVFFSEDLLTLIFGNEYREAAPAFAILCTAFALQAAMIGINGFLSASRDIARFVKYAVASLVINVVISVALIPKYGVNGAAIAVLVSKIFEMGSSVYLCRSIWGKSVFMLRHYLDVALLGILMVGVILVLQKLLPEFFLCAPLSGVAYLCATGLLILRIRKRLLRIRDQERAEEPEPPSSAGKPEPEPDTADAAVQGS